MLNTILASKMKMGQTFVEGVRLPVTHVKAGPCVVTQVKKMDTDGYWGLQLGFGEKKIKNVTKPLQGHLKGAIQKKKAPRFLREVKFNEKPDYKIGDVINISDIFKKGDVISVTGTSKGKGFAGVMKRWGFAGGPRTHGQSDRQRAPGSIGQGTDPGRVHKGKKMGGRMGTDRKTIKNLFVIDIDEENNQLLLSGPVPGVSGGLLMITKLASGKLSDLVKEEVQQVSVDESEVEGEEAKEAGSTEKSDDLGDTAAKEE